MSLQPLPRVDTRAAFRPLTSAFTGLLRALPADAWLRPAVRSWRVRDVVAHMTDTAARRLSVHRDGHQPPPPRRTIASPHDFAAFINELNADGVALAERFSPRMLTESYAAVSAALADFAESLPLDGPPCFPVSWAGDAGHAPDALWLDIGREFMEQWHHQMQVREAVVPIPDASSGTAHETDPAWCDLFLRLAAHGLPHAYGHVAAPDGAMLLIEITSAAPSRFTLLRVEGRWLVAAGEPEAGDRNGAPQARARLSDDTAWRLFTNGLSPADASRRIDASGDARLTAPLLAARMVVV